MTSATSASVLRNRSVNLHELLLLSKVREDQRSADHACGSVEDAQGTEKERKDVVGLRVSKNPGIAAEGLKKD